MIHITQDTREKIEGKFEREVKWLLDHAFTNSTFFTLSETAKYRPMEDETIWEMNKGKRNEVVEVYHKGEWICDVHSGMTSDEIVNRVWRIMQFNKAEKLRKEAEKNATTNNPASK